jgi:hypothetical protein
MKEFVCYLLLLFVVIPGSLVHPWPRWHCTRIEHIASIDETDWFKADGTLCGAAWPEGDGVWYAFHKDGITWPGRMSSKSAAYAQIEWWCRP